MKENNKGTSGIGFFGLLTILFIGLKLTGFIDWSWFWVLSPILIPIVLLLILFVTYKILEKIFRKKHRKTTKNYFY